MLNVYLTIVPGYEEVTFVLVAARNEEEAWSFTQLSEVFSTEDGDIKLRESLKQLPNVFASGNPRIIEEC